MSLIEQGGIAQKVEAFYDTYGQKKPMGESALLPTLPHYFLLRPFLGENDLLIIFNTKRCAYQCDFCQLPAKSSKTVIPSEDIVAQFLHVLEEERHALSLLDRVTLSNEGSVLDDWTFPTDALFAIQKDLPAKERIKIEKIFHLS